MKTAFTIAYPHGSEKATMLFGPPLTCDDQRQAFKELCSERTNSQYRLVEVWESSSGVVKKMRFNKPEVKSTTVTPSTLQTPRETIVTEQTDQPRQARKR